MYERMLDKGNKPSADAFQKYCGEAEELFDKMNCFLLKELGSERMLRFP